MSIEAGVAKSKVTQVFRNPNSMILEGSYIFPIPEAASLTEFTMVMDGKVVKGEVLERDKARQIYEGIVRSMQDPALLEYVGSKMFRARVFPIPGKGTVEVSLTYVEELEAEGGVVEYHYPLKTQSFDKGSVAQIALHATVKSATGIKSVFSSSHQIDKARKSDNEVQVSFEGKRVVADRDFHLFYTLSNDAVGLHLLSDLSSRDGGYFMVSIAPKVGVDESEVAPKDVVFVVDTSGSMRDDDKMKEAKEALKYGIRGLRKGDRFNIVGFSTEARPYADKMIESSTAAIAEAASWVDRLSATGGTNINDALADALERLGAADRIGMIVFMTDGLPTVGETDVDKILEGARKKNGRKARFFCFGVGYDVNTRLLDTLAQDHRGSRDYVTPSQNIELVMSSFFDKISHPVLSDVSVSIDGRDESEVYPKQLPDIFKGTQLSLFGRYAKGGVHAIRLKGKLGGKEREFVYEGRFAESKGDRDFISVLWAKRKVGYLMDQIRINGANQELRQEVVRLGKKFGIATPYTSFLVTEDGEVAQGERRRQRGRSRFGRGGRNSPPPPGTPPVADAQNGSSELLRRLGTNPRSSNAPARKTAPRPGTSGGVRGGTTGGARRSGEARPRKDAEGLGAGRNRQGGHPLGSTGPSGGGGGKATAMDKRAKRERDLSFDAGEKMLEEVEGKNAVAGSLFSKKLQEELADDGKSSGLTRQRVGERTFEKRLGVWVDVSLDAMKDEEREGKVKRVESFSARYFELIKAKPELAKLLAKMPQLLIEIDGEVLWFIPAPKKAEEAPKKVEELPKKEGAPAAPKKG